MSNSKILIDKRVGSKELASIHPISSLDTVLTELSSADVAFSGYGPEGPVLIGIELKSLDDLLSSMQNMRLQDNQIRKMLDTYYTSYLVYYGSYRNQSAREQLRSSCKQPGLRIKKHENSKRWYNKTLGRYNGVVTYSTIPNFLAGLADLGIPSFRASSKSEAAHIIYALFKRWQKRYTTHKSFKGFHIPSIESRRTKTDKSKAVLFPSLDKRTEELARFAIGIPGLGYHRAVAAAKHFRSPFEMVVADEREWKKVEKIGPKVASRVVEFLRQKKG